MLKNKSLHTITIALFFMSTLLTLNLVGGVAHAQTDIYVDAATGDNKTGDGSTEKPYKTITFALARSSQLGTPEPWHIHVRPGVYDADTAKPPIDREVFPLRLRNGMILEGMTTAAECIIDAKHITSSTFPILEGVGLKDVTIRNLTLQNMNRTSGNGGAIYLENTTGTLEGCVIRDNRAGGVWTNQSITIINNIFSGNSDGGFFVDGNFTGNVSGHTFSGNSTAPDYGHSGGGFSVSGNFTGDVLANTFSGNLAGNGGGFFVKGNFTGDVSANTFSGNSGGWKGNGSGFSVDGNLTGDVSGNTFSGNSVGWGRRGGGFSVGTLSGNVSSNTFSRNYADHQVGGGGFFIDTLNGNVSSNIFSRNTGGFYLNRGTAKVFNNLFLHNSAQSRESVVYTSAVTTFENNLFMESGNSTVSTVWLSSNQCRFHNNIFAGMQTAIFETGQFDLPITHNIFHNIGTDIVNRGGSGVGNDVLFWELLADRASDNLDLAPMFVGEGIAQEAWTGIYDSARNETTLTNANASWKPNAFAGALVNGFLILSNTETTLQVQGNIVAAGVNDYQIDDYRLQATSPAINAGTNEHAPPEDILGALRPLKDGVVDIGPYEFGGQLPIAAKITLSTNPASTPADGKSQATLTATVTDESGKPHTRETVTITVASGGGSVSPVRNNRDGTYTATYTAGTAAGEVKIEAKTSNGKVAAVTLPLTKSESGGLTRGTFNLALLKGLNLISLPVRPDTPFTAQTLIDKLSATMLTRFDAGRQKFVPYLPGISLDFPIEGGLGYIINVTQAQTITGTVWDNVTTSPPAPPLRGEGSSPPFPRRACPDLSGEGGRGVRYSLGIRRRGQRP